MLHSDDADINKVIREIIELDKKAIRIKKNASEMVDQLFGKTKKELKEKENAEILNAQGLAQKNYEIEMKKAKEEYVTILNAKNEEILKIRQKYNEAKEEKACEVLNELFNPATEIDN